MKLSLLIISRPLLFRGRVIGTNSDPYRFLLSVHSYLPVSDQYSFKRRHRARVLFDPTYRMEVLCLCARHLLLISAQVRIRLCQLGPIRFDYRLLMEVYTNF